MTEQEKYDQRCNEISILRAEASRNPELVRANIFYLEHPDFWIHPLAASDEIGDKDRATLRVHLAMAEYARTAELTAYLEACKAKCGHCAGTSHSLPDIVDPEPYFRPAGYVCNFGDLPDSYVHKTNWIECVPCAATEIRSLTRFAELNK